MNMLQSRRRAIFIPAIQFVGMDEWKMGSVLDGSLDQKKKLLFSKTNVYEKSECRTCWLNFIAAAAATPIICNMLVIF